MKLSEAATLSIGPWNEDEQVNVLLPDGSWRRMTLLAFRCTGNNRQYDNPDGFGTRYYKRTERRAA